MNIRQAKKNDLNGLLNLYTNLHDNPFPDIDDALIKIWDGILKDKNHHIIILERESLIISSCVLITVPNLTHGLRPYAIIENVITQMDYRNCGYGSKVLEFAENLAREKNCYKIMLLTGSKEQSVFNFYQKAGFNRKDKTAFIKWL